MTGYTGKLQGTPNKSHVVQMLPPCSKPMPHGLDENMPTWSCRHYDGIFSEGERVMRNRRVSAQNRRERNRKKNEQKGQPLSEIFGIPKGVSENEAARG